MIYEGRLTPSSWGKGDVLVAERDMGKKIKKKPLIPKDSMDSYSQVIKFIDGKIIYTNDIKRVSTVQ